MRFSAPAILVVLVLAAGCGLGGGSGPDGAATPTPTVPVVPTPTAEIQPVTFPADEGPHDALTEWWYYTGHLFDAGGGRYGFEFVIFQVRQPGLPAYYASHFALTDNQAATFSYAQKSGFGAATEQESGFHFVLDDWELSGAGGRDKLRASMDGYFIDLTLTSSTQPVLHNRGSGYMDIAAAAGSYYYSRPSMEVSGVLLLDDLGVEVTGAAWMDHQWGDFVLIEGGGWDWFSVQLDDGASLMVFELRGTEAAGDIPDYGTLVEADGSVIHLAETDYSIVSHDTWTSPHSGATYPVDWSISIPSRDLTLNVKPTLLDQELDTRATTGTIYWEGEVVVEGVRGADAVSGLGYVELTGYAADDLLSP